jgi:hypothetical protein
MAVPRSTETAKFIRAAPYLTIGDHTSLDLDPGGNWIVKPNPYDTGLEPTHIQMQAFNQNVRYTIDNSHASATHGFQLPAGAITTVPVPNRGISLFEEATGAIIQYQWLG